MGCSTVREANCEKNYIDLVPIERDEGSKEGQRVDLVRSPGVPEVLRATNLYTPPRSGYCLCPATKRVDIGTNVLSKYL
jgi:hypothetical protein